MMTKRLLVAVSVGLFVAGLRLWFNIGPGDFSWPYCAARALLTAQDPYGAACVSYRPDGAPWVVNPLTTALPFMVLTWIPPTLVTALILLFSSTLMAYGLLKDGDPYRLMIFLSVPYVQAWYYGQWSPLILGVALTPVFLPLVLIKPHIGLPALLMHMTRKRVLGVALFGLLSLLLMPSWPVRWLAQSGAYDGYIPILTLPGVALLVLLCKWRDHDAQYLLLCALVPQRGVYDAIITAAVVRSRLEVLVWVLSGWALVFINPYSARLLPNWLIVCCLYLLLAALLLARRRDK